MISSFISNKKEINRQPLPSGPIKLPTEDIDFPGKDKDETVSIIVRRHWIVYFTHGFISIILLILPLAIALIIRSVFSIQFSAPINELLILGGSLFYISLGTQFAISFMNYYFDIWIITNKRIIALEQISLFNRTVSELPLANVQDITIERKGLLATILDFGTIFVQTAGRRARFIFETVPDIYAVKEELNNLVENAITKEHAHVELIKEREREKEQKQARKRFEDKLKNQEQKNWGE